MPYKDADKRRQADRERKRRARSCVVVAVAAAGTEKDLSPPSAPDFATDGSGEPPSAKGVLGVLANELRLVVGLRCDPLARARVVGTLAGVYLKGLEITELEARLKALETSIGKDRNYG